MLKGGIIKVSANVEEVTVYDINGAILYKGAPQAGVIETGLESGVYVVKATGSNCGKTLKALF